MRNVLSKNIYFFALKNREKIVKLVVETLKRLPAALGGTHSQKYM